MDNELDDEYTVYRAWSETEVQQALEDFRKIMYGGGSIQELSAGIFCFDFLTTRSDLSENLVRMVNLAVEQARMRIDLMQQQETLLSEAAFEEQRKALEMSLANMGSVMNRVMQRARNMDPDELRRCVRRRFKLEEA